MPRFYDSADSTNAMKVRFLLAELGEAGADVERVEVPLRGARPAEYAALHPFGLLPCLVDGELVISESNTILRYLAERAGRDDLRGATPAQRARVDTILDSLSLELRPALLGVEELVIYGGEVGEAERAAREDGLAAKLVAFDRLLHADGPFALGEALTIADCAIAGRAAHLERLGLAGGVAPRTRRVLGAVLARGVVTA